MKEIQVTIKYTLLLNKYINIFRSILLLALKYDITCLAQSFNFKSILRNICTWNYVNLLNQSSLMVFCKYLLIFSLVNYVLFSFFYICLNEGWSTWYLHNLLGQTSIFSCYLWICSVNPVCFTQCLEHFWKKDTCLHTFYLIYVQQSFER